ncbi:MAG: sporulation protein YunB [Clostridia bacterium]|jgi:sporulation protein YunB|nr:sporulation protein YunB [Clostridia bacterium]
MDNIYSRNTVKFPKIIYKKFNKKQSKKILKVLLIVIIAISTCYLIINAINPIFKKLCSDKAKSIATLICNSESTKILKNYEYEDLITIDRDKNNNITMIKSNITPINLIISDVAENIQKRINETEEEEIAINLGSFTGSKILSGRGPKIPIKLSAIGNVETDLRSEFKEAGINQTLHRIYLQVNCKMSILTPYENFEENISNQILIAENVIVGNTPQTYYNLQGLEQRDSLEIIE